MKYGCVILADVHHRMLEASRGLLDTKFHTVVMVSSYESLLEASVRIRPDLIVADLSLPSSDGYKLLLKLDAQLKEFKIIILGNYDEKEIVDSIIRKGVRGYVQKQMIATDLLQAVDMVLKEEIYISRSSVTE